jgi:hypothetical protein
MATSIKLTNNGDKREVTNLKELMALLRAGPLPQGVTASPTLLDEMEGTPKGPTTEQATTLFKEIERKVPQNTLGEDKWYLVAVSTALLSISPNQC